jgi:hypothetical protein
MFVISSFEMFWEKRILSPLVAGSEPFDLRAFLLGLLTVHFVLPHVMVWWLLSASFTFLTFFTFFG